MKAWIDPWRTAILPAEAELMARALAGDHPSDSGIALKRSIVLGDRADGALSFSGIFDVFEYSLGRWWAGNRPFPVGVSIAAEITDFLAESLDSNGESVSASPFLIAKQVGELREFLLYLLGCVPVSFLTRYGCPSAMTRIDHAVGHIRSLWNRLALGLLWTTREKSPSEAPLTGAVMTDIQRWDCVPVRRQLNVAFSYTPVALRGIHVANTNCTPLERSRSVVM